MALTSLILPTALAFWYGVWNSVRTDTWFVKSIHALMCITFSQYRVVIWILFVYNSIQIWNRSRLELESLEFDSSTCTPPSSFLTRHKPFTFLPSVSDGSGTSKTASNPKIINILSRVKEHWNCPPLMRYSSFMV